MSSAKISILIIFPLFSNVNTKYVCQKNTTVYLSFNEVAFFQTPIFPSLISYNTSRSCNLTFSLIKENINTDYKLFAVFIQTTKIEDHGFSETNSITIQISKNSFYTPRCKGCLSSVSELGSNDFAQQGFLTFDSGVNGCPLESISQPFNFVDESQFIYIQSSFEKHFFRPFPCSWSFQVPEGYGFKIVVQKFIVSSNTTLRIWNSTDLFVNERSVKLLHPIYNDDSFVKILLSENNNIYFVPEMEFLAYISVFKKGTNSTQILCDVIIEEDMNDVTRIHWTHFNGYKNNGYCSMNISIPQKTFYMVQINMLQLEANVDIIQYNLDNFNMARIENIKTFYLFPVNNGLERNVTFEFISDGSIQMLGFNIMFTKMRCECENKIIECDQGLHSMITGDFLCAGMNCNFTLQPCSTELSFFQATQSRDAIELFRLLSNETLIIDLLMETVDATAIVAVVNSSNHNFVEIITSSVSAGQSIFFLLSPFEIPPILNIDLSSNIPFAITDMGLHQCVSYQISETLQTEMKNNLTFIFYCNMPYYAAIYNNKSFSKNLLGYNCLGNNNEYRCEVKERQFIACNIGAELELNQIFAVRLAKKVKGCVFEETIFPVKTYDDVFTVSAISTFEDYCVIILLLDPDYNFNVSHIWTSATNETVKIFFGENQKRLFFEFDSKSAEKLKVIGLFSKVYSIQIPKGAAFIMSLKKIKNASNKVAFPMEPFNSFFSTPYYGISKGSFEEDDITFVHYTVHQLPVTFTVIEYKMSPKDIFNTSLSNLKITGVGDSFTVKNMVVSLSYQSAEKNNAESGILFFVTTDIGI